MYVIRAYSDGTPFNEFQIVDGGQTREQVKRALERLDVTLTSDMIMPRVGRALFIVQPVIRQSYVITVT